MDKKRKAPGRNIDNNFTGFNDNEFQEQWLKYDIEHKVTWNASNPEHRAELRKLGIVVAEVDPEAALGLAQAIHSHDVDGVEGEPAAFQSTIHRYTMQGEVVNDVMCEHGFDKTLHFLDNDVMTASYPAGGVLGGMRAHRDSVNEDNNLARFVFKMSYKTTVLQELDEEPDGGSDSEAVQGF